MNRRKLSLLFLLLIIAAAPTYGATQLIGNIVSSDNQMTAGMYKFSTTDPIQISLLSNESEPIVANGGAVCIDDKLYVYYYEDKGFYLMAYNYIYDTKTWVNTGSTSPTMGDWEDVAISTALDPTTGTVYCCTYNSGQTGFELKTWDVAAKTKTRIADAGTGYPALAASPDGELFAIDTEGRLLNVDKSTGETTEIGSTGFRPKGAQSATFDQSQGGEEFYWFAYNDSESALYKVNTQTAEITKIADIEGHAQVVAAYAAEPEAADKAPSAAENITVDFTGASLSGAISFSIPSLCYDGTALIGNVDYDIYVDGAVRVSGVGKTPGSIVEETVTVAQAGTHEFKVILKNTTGPSPEAAMEKWIGADTPLAVSAVEAKYSDGTVNVTWQAPEGGVHGGYVNAEEITYKVVRQPGDEVVKENTTETSFSETLTSETIKLYSYDVTASFMGNESEMTSSNTVKVGEYVALPFNDTFDTSASFAYYTVIDNNKDGKTWLYDGGQQCAYDNSLSVAQCDDYLILPPVKMSKSDVYKLTFKAKNLVYAESFEVLMGSSPEPSAMTSTIIEETQLQAEQVFEKDITVSEDGVKYIAIHHTTQGGGMYLYIDDISIENNTQSAPGQVQNFTVTAGAEGALSADIAFNAPVSRVDGTELDAITKIELYRDTELIHTFESPATGAELTYIDNDAVSGFNTYRAIAYNDYGAGRTAECRAYIGKDAPGNPRNVVFSDLGDNRNKIVWEEAETGKNGGYVEPGSTVFDIYRVISSEPVCIAQDVTTAEYIDEECPVEDGIQTIVYYNVRARNAIGESGDAQSNMLMVGSPYPAPLDESFSNAALSTQPWMVDRFGGETNDAGWSLYRSGSYDMEAQDGDNGFAMFTGNVSGAKSLISSPKIDISGLEEPGLEFYVSLPYLDTDFTAMISVDNGEFTAISETMKGGTTDFEWTQVIIPLEKYAGAGQIRIGLLGEVTGQTGACFVDNLSVRDIFDNDIEISGFTGPNVTTAGNVCTYAATVVNCGIKTVSDASIEFLLDGTVVGQDVLPELAAGESTVVEFEYVSAASDNGKELVFSSRLVIEDDNGTNDTSGTVVTVVRSNNYPAPEDLQASVENGNIMLSWTAPDYESGVHAEICDDFESYTTFAISGIGDYTLIDADKSMTYRLGNTDYENATAMMAFQVFDPQKAGIADESFSPKSGKQMLISVAALSGENDDWLITPELAQDCRYVSFYAKSITDRYGLEQFEAWYSTSGTDTDDFTKFETGTQEAPADWTEFAYRLPEGTKYFAIRYVSKDKYALAIDDLSYTPADGDVESLELLGYNVYRDGVRINDDILTDASCADSSDGQNHTYAVTAVYDLGESDFSDEIETGAGGVGSVCQDIRIYAAAGVICVDGAAGDVIEIYSLEGRLLYAEKADGNKEIVGMLPGYYIVKAGGMVAKLAVQ